VVLYLDQGATILAADTPREGTASGYDPAESNVPGRIFRISATTIGTTA